MKTLKMAFPLLALVCASLAPKAAQAKETRDLEASRLAARSYWYQVSANSSPALSLYYVGTATESLVYISSTLITAFAPIGTADTGFGTALGSYDLSAAAYDTFGELCDAIDGLANYGCRLLGAKRDDNTNRLRDQAATSGTNDLKAAGGFDVKFDTAPVAGGGTPEAFDLRVGVTPESGKRVVMKKCEWNANGANTALIYGRAAVRQPVQTSDVQDGDLTTPTRCTARSSRTTPRRARPHLGQHGRAGDGSSSLRTHTSSSRLATRLARR